MRYLPIVLLIGIVSNFLCLVVFRLKLDRKFQSQFSDLSYQLNQQLISFSTQSLSRIDDYFRSNLQSRVTSPSQVSFSEKDEYDPKSILFLDSGECDYYYYVYDGNPVARIGISDFRVGNPFPRGGAITAIFPDYLIVDNTLSFRNRSYTPFSSNVSYTSLPPAQVYEATNKPVKQYESVKELKNVE